MSAAVILVVDDDAVCCRICRTALESAGLTVVTAPTAEAALGEFSGPAGLVRHLDLVVADYLMPGRNGLSLFRELRRDRPDLDGLLLTGHASLNVAVEALNRGFSQILSKPVDTEALLDAVAGALRDGQTRRENARLQALNHLYRALNPLTMVSDQVELAQRIVELAIGETTADSASLMLYDESRRMLRLVAAVGLEEGLVGDVELPLGEPIAGWVLERGLTLELAGGRPIPGLIRQAMHREQLQAGVVVPLVPMGERIGVLSVSWRQGTAGFGPGDVEIAGVLAADAAPLLQRLKNQRERRRHERISTVGRLASSIIHDLRGPVTIIQGAAELLAEIDPSIATPMGRIRNQTQILDRLCEQLLSFSRHASSAQSRRCEVDELLESLHATLRDDHPDCALALEPAADRLLVDTSPSELVRALAELIVAADGSPRVSVEPAGGMVRLRLAGLGRPVPAELPSDGLVTADGSGLGLSLVLLRHIVERHAGRVTAGAGEREIAIEMPAAGDSDAESCHHTAGVLSG